jgi:hypothetical protein
MMESGSEPSQNQDSKRQSPKLMKSFSPRNLPVEINGELIDLQLINSYGSDIFGAFHRLNAYNAVSSDRGVIDTIQIVQLDKDDEWGTLMTDTRSGEGIMLRLEAGKAARKQEADFQDLLGRVMVTDFGARVHISMDGISAGFGIARPYTDVAGREINPRWGAVPVFSWGEACKALGISPDRETASEILDEILVRAGVRLDDPNPEISTTTFHSGTPCSVLPKNHREMLQAA